MPNTGINGGGGGLRAEDVISKLKDEGDFDRLRLKIIRKLKNNEDLRSNIISLVKQSSALNRPGAENMKPRQLSDAIHQEIGDKLMSQISDGLWNVIRSGDGLKTEITETVQSVYDKLANPHSGQSSDSRSIRNQLGNNGVVQIHEGEPNEPPGFGVTVQHRSSKMNQPIQENLDLQEHQNLDIGAPPGFSSVLENKNLGVYGDEDPDVPPGFG